MNGDRVAPWLSTLPGVGALLIVAFAVLGLQPGGGGKPPAPPAVAPGPTSATTQSNTGQKTDASATKSGVEEYLQTAGLFRPDGRASDNGANLQFLVVTLPDPLLSADGTRSDLETEAVTHAMAAAGYALDGYWFPWQPKTVDKDGRVSERVGRPGEEPGVLLYRNGKERAKRFAVLVVGESAVTGIQVKALKAAFDLAAGPAHKNRIRLVSPSFSGNQASLARTALEWSTRPQVIVEAFRRNLPVVPPCAGLDQWALAAFSEQRDAYRSQLSPPIRVVSGAALGLQPWNEIDPDNAPRLLQLFGAEPVERTSIPLTALRSAALHYLSAPNRAGPDRNLAEAPDALRPYASLIEMDTGFGATAQDVTLPDKPPGEGQVADQPTDTQRTTTPERGAAPGPRPAIAMRFPIHISRAAGLLSKEQREREERLGLNSHGRLSLTALDAIRSGGDLLPAADDGRTAALNLLRLDHYWDLIRREKVRHVEVIATDPRDKLFLIRLLRENCPNVLPFTYGPSAQFGHPDYLPFTRGVVVVGTYPHRPGVQYRTVPGTDLGWRGTFGSDAAQGTYNAVLAQLDIRAGMLDYAPPGGVGNVPPVWVSVVGEDGGFVPLAYFTNYPGRELMFLGRNPDKPDGEVKPFRPPHPAALRWLVLFVSLGAVAAVAAAVAALRRPAGRPDVYALRTLYATLTAGGVLFAGLPFASYFALFLESWSALDQWDRAATEAVLAITLTALVCLAAVFVLWAAGVAKDIARVEVVRRVGRGVRAVARPPARAAVWVVLATIRIAAGLTSRVFILLTAGVAAAARVATDSRAGRWAARLAGRLLPAGLSRHVAGFLYRVGRAGWRAARWARAIARTAPARWLRGRYEAIPCGVAWTGASALTLLAFAATAVVIGWFAYDARRVDAARKELFAERVADLDSGASPLVPAVVFAVGFGLYGVIGLLLTRDMADVRVGCPYLPPKGGGGTPAAAGGAGAAVAVAVIAAEDERLHELLARPLRVFTLPAPAEGDRSVLRRVRWGGVITSGLVGLGAAMILYRAHPAWEARAWNCLFATGFIGLAYLTVVSAYRLYAVWKTVERVTRAVAVVPMVGAFDKLPDKVARVLGEYLLARRWRRLDLAVLEHIRDRTVTAIAEAAHKKKGSRAADVEASIHTWVKEDEHARVMGDPDAPDDRRYSDRLDRLAELSRLLVAALGPHWATTRRATGEAFGKVPVQPDTEGPAPRVWTDWAEQFVAVTAVVYLAQFFVRMRRLAMMAAAAAGALLTAAAAYQFQPERLIMTAGLVLAGAVVGLTVWVLYRVNRNELVSRVCRSTPNRFSLDSAFVSNVVTLVLPLILVIAAQFAGRTRALVEPVLGWFH